MKILFCILVLLSSYSFAYALSCTTFSRLPDKEHGEKLKEVDIIFYGEVVSVADLGFQSYLIKFTVLKVWKGDKTNEITVKYANPCSSSVFPVGTKLMVYGYALKNEPFIDVNCCNFGLFDDDRMKLELGEGIDVEQPTPEAKQTSEEGFWSVLWKTIISFFS